MPSLLHDDDDSDDNDWDDKPITVTYVGDASRATVYITYTDDDNDSLFGDDNDSNTGDTDSNDGDLVNGDDSVDDDRFRTHSIACEIANGIAICTYADIGRVNNQTTTSFVATRSHSARPIALITSSGRVSTTSATTTGTGIGTSTGTSAAATNSATADPQTSGAQENFAAGAVVAGLSAAVAAMALV
ncbi:hypothetical protein ACEPAI_1391 [Sanghuangporus weigelae]